MMDKLLETVIEKLFGEIIEQFLEWYKMLQDEEKFFFVVLELYLFALLVVFQTFTHYLKVNSIFGPHGLLRPCLTFCRPLLRYPHG